MHSISIPPRFDLSYIYKLHVHKILQTELYYRYSQIGSGPYIQNAQQYERDTVGHLNTILHTSWFLVTVQGRTQRCCCRGALKSEVLKVLNRAVKGARRGEYESGVEPPLSLGGPGASPGKFDKIYVSKNAFQAILKPIFFIFYSLNFK